MSIQRRIVEIAAIATLAISAQAASGSKVEQTAKRQVRSVPGEYVVKFKHSVNPANLMSIKSATGLQIKSIFSDGNLGVVQMPKIQIASSAIQTLENNSLIELAEPNYIYELNKTPNDADYGKLWGLNNTGQTDTVQSGIPGIDIGAEKAWDITTGNKDLVVAVIDTGVDHNNPNLKPNMWTNGPELAGKTGVDDDGNGFVDDIYGYNFHAATPNGNADDDYGHGSHCAGTIGGSGNDGLGVVGVNWNIKIMSVKFLSGDGGTLEGAIKSIDYATLMKADIMSNSWGGGGYTKLLEEAIQRAEKAGIVFVAAAGNETNDNDATATYPASYDVSNVIAVAAIDNKGKLASFSNWGKTKVHVGAPGVKVYSTILGNKYDSWSGTSMATPHVSGIVGLMLANEPGLTPSEIKDRLIKTAVRLPSLKGKTVSGGMANAYNALTNTVPGPDMNDPENWTQQSPAAYSSDHPYKSKTKTSFEINVPGAKEFAVYFSRFDTERNYDWVRFYDAKGVKVAEMSGKFDASFSPVIAGNYVRIEFTSDDSVEGYGFDISKIAFR